MDRTGAPLPGVTPSQLVSQLVHRALWPTLSRVAAVLEWLGVAGAGPARPTRIQGAHPEVCVELTGLPGRRHYPTAVTITICQSPGHCR